MASLNQKSASQDAVDQSGANAWGKKRVLVSLVGIPFFIGWGRKRRGVGFALFQRGYVLLFRDFLGDAYLEDMVVEDEIGV